MDTNNNKGKNNENLEKNKESNDHIVKAGNKNNIEVFL